MSSFSVSSCIRLTIWPSELACRAVGVSASALAKMKCMTEERMSSATRIVIRKKWFSSSVLHMSTPERHAVHTYASRLPSGFAIARNSWPSTQKGATCTKLSTNCMQPVVNIALPCSTVHARKSEPCLPCERACATSAAYAFASSSPRKREVCDSSSSQRSIASSCFLAPSSMIELVHLRERARAMRERCGRERERN